jgi:5'-nucleotidase
MNILLTNDDGINHPGLINLRKAVEKKHNVTVIAPEKQRSAYSHKITIHAPIRILKIDNKTFSTDGTPADCVKFGIKGLIEEKIDLVISGINEGPNMGIDVFYSGTVGAAREGLINKVPSIAFSVNSYDGNCDWEKTAEAASDMIDTLFPKYFEDGVMYNINFPSSAEYKGKKLTKLGNRVFKEIIVKRNDPMGREYFWLGGEFPSYKAQEGSDFTAVEEGFISITPLSLDITHKEVLNKFKGNFD